MKKKICPDCGAQRGTPHAESCSNAPKSTTNMRPKGRKTVLVGGRRYILKQS